MLVLFGHGLAELSVQQMDTMMLIVVGFAIVGMYNNLIRRPHREFLPLEVSALTAVWPAGVAFLGALRVALDAGSVAAIVWLGLAAGALACYCASYAVSKIGPGAAWSFLYLNPVISVADGWWLLVGAAMILVELALAIWEVLRRPNLAVMLLMWLLLR